MSRPNEASLGWVDSSCVLAMDFDDGSCNDRSVYLNNGTPVSGPVIVAGIDGGLAMQFDGVDDAITTPLRWSAGSAVTVSLWVKSVAQDSSAFGGPNEDPNRFQSHLPFSDNTLYWDYGNSAGAGRISTSFAAYLNKWTHVVLVSSGPANTFNGIYINGNLITSASSSSSPGGFASGFRIGRFGSQSKFNGSMDKIAIFNRVISAAEAKQLYEDGLH